MVSYPRAWRTVTLMPLPPCQPAISTVPSATARTGVPTGAP